MHSTVQDTFLNKHTRHCIYNEHLKNRLPIYSKKAVSARSLYETLTTKNKKTKNRQALAVDLYGMARQHSLPLTNLKKPIETLLGSQIGDSQVSLTIRRSGYFLFKVPFLPQHTNYARETRLDNSVVLVKDG